MTSAAEFKHLGSPRRRRQSGGQSPSRLSSSMVSSCSPKRDMSDCRATAAWLSARDSLSRSFRGDTSWDESQRGLDGSRRTLDFPGGSNSVPNCLRGSPERATGSGGEDVIKDVYRRHASSFFDELRTWFTTEVRSLRSSAEKQLETDQLKSLRSRVEKLETTTLVNVPQCTSAGDVAAGSATSQRSLSPIGRLAMDGQALDAASLRVVCREEARCALEELRGELLGGDLLCDELLSGGAGLRPALERLIAESSIAKRESGLRAQIAELRASIDGAAAAATAAATAEIGRLDNAFRSSLASEVRDLGSLCENVRARIEALDESAADHVGRLSARIAELEEIRSAPSRGGSIRTDASTSATVGSAKEFTTSVGSSKEDAGFTGNMVWPGFADRCIMARQPPGIDPSPSVVDCEEPPRASPVWQPIQEQDEIPHQSTLENIPFPGCDELMLDHPHSTRGMCSSSVDTSAAPPFCTGLAPVVIGSKSSVPQAPSTPPKRHVPPASTSAGMRTSPDIRGNAAVAGRTSVGGQKTKQCGRTSMGGQKSPLPQSPRMEARGGC